VDPIATLHGTGPDADGSRARRDTLETAVQQVLGRFFVNLAPEIVPASFPNSVPMSVSSTISYRLNTLGVRCPVIFIVPDSLMPARRRGSAPRSAAIVTVGGA